MKGKWKLILISIAILMITVGGFILVQIKKEPIILEFGMFTGSNWGVANADSFVIIDKAIQQFEEQHPGVEVHYDSGIRKEDYSQWLASKALLGKAPDVFMVSSGDFYKFASLDILENLDRMQKEDREFNKDRYYPSTLQAGKFHGGQYALPYEVVPMLLFVNKTLLKQEGIDMPSPQWTWDDLYQISQAVTRDINGDGKIEQFGTYNYSWKEAAYSNGANLFDENGTTAYFTDEKVMNSIKYVKRLLDLNQDQKVTQDDFDGGNVAFMPLPFSEYRTYKTYPYKIKKYTSFQWDCITMPAGPEGDNQSEVNTLLMSINKQSKHKELAWEFLKLLTYNEEIQRDIFRHSQGASALKAVTTSKEVESILAKDMEQGDKVINSELLNRVMEDGVNTPKFPEYDEVMTVAESRITQVFEKGVNIDSALKILQRNVNHILQQ